MGIAACMLQFSVVGGSFFVGSTIKGLGNTLHLCIYIYIYNTRQMVIIVSIQSHGIIMEYVFFINKFI